MASNGAMARMNTLHPLAFAKYLPNLERGFTGFDIIPPLRDGADRLMTGVPAPRPADAAARLSAAAGKRVTMKGPKRAPGQAG